jgi:hypothetical protein
MTVNSIIREADYNNIRNKIVAIIGTGSGTSGWGQTIVSSAVSVGNRVSINNWGGLRFDIINAWTHINGSAPTTVQVFEGNTIRSSVVDAPYTTYDTIVDTIVANKFTVHPSQSAIEAGTPSQRTDSWSTTVSCTISVSFPSATTARHFFNSGGQIRIASSRTGGAATQQNTAWTSILSTAGTQSFGGNNPGTGTSPLNGQNWYRLTNSYQQWFIASGSSPYGSNNYRIFARCPVADNSTGTANSAEFLVQFTDGYVDPGTVLQPGESVPRNPADFPPGDLVDGTLSVAASSLYATGILVPSGTGNFTVTRPTISVGAIA